MTRRRLLAGAGAAVAGAAALAAVGCGDDDDGGGAGSTPAPGQTGQPGGSPSAAATPRRGGTLRINQTGDIVLNAGYPFVVAPTNRILPWLVHEPLIRYRNDVRQPELVLAESFEYSADRTKLLVRLKPGVTFHDGAPLTPEDVFFSIDFSLNPKAYGVTVAGTPSQLAKAIVERKKVDERTMEFRFDRARWDMTGYFASLNIHREGSLAKMLAGEAVNGTGPYALEKWTPGVGLAFVPNRNWHLTAQEGGPYLDRVEARIFTDETAAATAFEANELDVAFRLPGADARRFRDRVRKAPRIGGLFMGMVVKNPLLSDPRVRQAVFWAIDRDRIAKEVGEGFYPATAQIWPEYSPAFDPELDRPYYDPERAKALLRQAGFSQDRPLEVPYTQRSEANVLIVKENLEAIGIKVSPKLTETAVFINTLRQRKYGDFYVAGMNFADPVPSSALLNNFNIAIPNQAYQESPELKAILDVIGTVDPLGEEAKALYRRFNRLWVEDPWIAVLEPSGALDVASEKVQGFDEYFILPLQAPNFGRIWLKG
jgi:peptide/nickel transport system substrate-binding protein